MCIAHVVELEYQKYLLVPHLPKVKAKADQYSFPWRSLVKDPHLNEIQNQQDSYLCWVQYVQMG